MLQITEMTKLSVYAARRSHARARTEFQRGVGRSSIEALGSLRRACCVSTAMSQHCASAICFGYLCFGTAVKRETRGPLPRTGPALGPGATGCVLSLL